jgi:phosphoribosylformylglycinamidine cyclo-ligase
VRADDAQRTVDVARACGVLAWVAGQVEAGAKQLHIEPLGVRFSGDDLQLR